MAAWSSSSSKLTSTFGVILPALLSVSIQRQYSACGKETRGVKKLLFKDTKSYAASKAVCMEKDKLTEKDVILVLSRWRTGSTDRDYPRRGSRVRNPVANPANGRNEEIVVVHHGDDDADDPWRIFFQ